ncbi:MAG TPA: fimbria/pilus periplasmic chaperone, partial [Ramlibacter sp.]|nr:fimbria/pilus periplasmic chaperone [Ramlibacter sp.]
EFSVTPIRADLKPGSLTETITVGNDSKSPLRVSVRLMEWTQDEKGEDVYKESGDLVYFPRQMDIGAGARRVVRLGAKNIPPDRERAYRLFIEEMGSPLEGASTGVSFYFRFGVPIFVAPPSARHELLVADPVVAQGSVRVDVQNHGTRHYRFNRVVFSNGSGFRKEVAGWYSLAGSRRSYRTELPGEVCRSSAVLTARLEGEGVEIERQVKVDPATCG